MLCKYGFLRRAGFSTSLPAIYEYTYNRFNRFIHKGRVSGVRAGELLIKLPFAARRTLHTYIYIYLFIITYTIVEVWNVRGFAKIIHVTPTCCAPRGVRHHHRQVPARFSN